MKKKILSVIKNRELWQTILFLTLGLFLGIYSGKYAKIRYENELMTNWLLKHEINDYVANKIGENVCLEN